MNISINNFELNDNINLSTSISYSENILISEKNKRQLNLIKSFSVLEKNWDSYNAEKPSSIAILKAMTFIIQIAKKKLDVFFVAPTADGDILVELKNNDSNLEFIFSGEVEDKIIATHNNCVHAEENLNETTYFSYLKWLICPNGTCPDF